MVTEERLPMSEKLFRICHGKHIGGHDEIVIRSDQDCPLCKTMKSGYKAKYDKLKRELTNIKSWVNAFDRGEITMLRLTDVIREVSYE